MIEPPQLGQRNAALLPYASQRMGNPFSSRHLKFVTVAIRIILSSANVLRVFTARSRRKNLVEQTLSRGACTSLEF